MINRRNFLKTLGAAGLGSAAAAINANAEPNEPNSAEKTAAKLPQVPRRKLGKTGVDVPVLSLGGDFSFLDKQIVLRKTLDWGVNYWETASKYANGNAELGMGEYIGKNPDVRKNLFLVTKASIFGEPITVEKIEQRLQNSLKRLKTDYIDLYYGIHCLADPSQLNDDIRKWAESAKKRKLIRFFGFSTHKNMQQHLMAASKLDWIDAIMTTFNFRLVNDKDMLEAIDACNKAGIGLVAMKTQGKGVNIEEVKKVANHFLEKGFTEGQAKIKILLENKAISSVCVGMQNIALLTTNVAAVLDNTKLSMQDYEVFNEYARATCSGYCTGCAQICESALPQAPYVSDIMRYLMYHNSYGDRDRARELFAEIPAEIRDCLLKIDYRQAEALCPQRMPIARLMAEAAQKLA